MADARLEGVTKTFGPTRVLDTIDLTLTHGEFITFVGPSGSGKSTLLRVISGLETVSSGRVFIQDRDVTQQPPRERNVAMVFQNYALYPHMTVAENITFGMRMRREPRAERTAALERAVAMLKLEGLLDRKPRQLSGGQRQRVAMARAIVRTPDLFLMDEPLSNLDAKLRNEVRLSIMDLHKTLGCTMVYVTHDQIEAMTMAHRIVVLDRGKIQQTGTPQELYHCPANIFTAGFIGTPGMNFIPLMRKGSGFFLPGNHGLILDRRLLAGLLDTGDVTLGIRPEHLSEGPGRQGEISLYATIVSSEMLGSQFLIHARLGTVDLRFFRENSGVRPLEGEQIRLSFPANKAHFFNTLTGDRLAIPQDNETIQTQFKVS